MYIQDYSGAPADVIAAALATAAFKKTPDNETALRLIGKEVEARFIGGLGKAIEAELTDVKEGYELVNGEYADNFNSENEKSAYESGLDDALEAALEPYEAHLSADWLGKNTVESGLWNENGPSAVAASAAKEVFKQLTADKTPGQILASAGIVAADVEAAIGAAKTAPKASADESDLGVVIGKIKARVGKDFDRLAVYEDLELIVTEDDEILVNAAASRLGLTENDAGVLQIAALDMDDAPTEIIEKIDAHDKPKGKMPKAQKAAIEASGDAVSADVLKALKHCGAGDTAMAEALGVSRSTYTGYFNGKTPFVPSEDQYEVVRKELVERANLVLGALHLFDGTELVQVA